LIAQFALQANIVEVLFLLLLVKVHQQITARPDSTVRLNQQSKTSSLLHLGITQGKVAHYHLNAKLELTTINGIWATQTKITQLLLLENP
jgi:hypothetical protein